MEIMHLSTDPLGGGGGGGGASHRHLIRFGKDKRITTSHMSVLLRSDFGSLSNVSDNEVMTFFV